jgi:hypothetical protein
MFSLGVSSMKDRKTPLSDHNHVNVLIQAAKGFLEKRTCICEYFPDDEACFFCEVEAAIKRAERELRDSACREAREDETGEIVMFPKAGLKI